MIEFLVELLAQLVGEIGLHFAGRFWVATVMTIAGTVLGGILLGPKGLMLGLPGLGAGIACEWFWRNDRRQATGALQDADKHVSLLSRTVAQSRR